MTKSEQDKLNNEIAALRWVFSQVVCELQNTYTAENLPDTIPFVDHIKKEFAQIDDVASAIGRVCEMAQVYIQGRSSAELTALCHAVDALSRRRERWWRNLLAAGGER